MVLGDDNNSKSFFPPSLSVSSSSSSSSSSSTLSSISTPPPSSSILTCAVPTTAGIALFTATLALSTWTQHKCLNISTGTRPRLIPSALGLLSVALASWTSHIGSIKVYELTGQRFGSQDRKGRNSRVASWSDNSTWKGWNERFTNAVRDMKDAATFNTNKRKSRSTSSSSSFDAVHFIRVCAVGLAAYKLLGGRFWSVSPSSYTDLGSFARAGIPATADYATPAQRSALRKLGRTFGCHTCGSRMMFARGGTARFVGDHVPPLSIARRLDRKWYRRLLGAKVRFRFYPQCVNCSSRQGGLLSTYNGRSNPSLFPVKRTTSALTDNVAKKTITRMESHFHGLRFRQAHLAGGVVAAMTVCDASEQDVLDNNGSAGGGGGGGGGGGNRRRFRQVHETLERWVSDGWIALKEKLPSEFR